MRGIGLFRLKNPRRTLALLVCLLLALSLLISAAFVLVERHHHCTGEHCEICVAVAHSVSFLKAETPSALPFESLAGFVAAIFLVLAAQKPPETRRNSLVTLKVKLSD